MNKIEEQQLQAKWDRILAKRGLSIYQPMTDNSEGEMAELSSAEIPRIRVQKMDAPEKLDRLKLRHQIDSNESFLMGHQITKVRTMEREIPEWALNDKEVQRVLLTAFPKLKTHHGHKARAARWARIIYLYYRMKQPRRIVAKELKMSDNTLKTTIRNIERVESGFTVRGEERRKRHPSDT